MRCRCCDIPMTWRDIRVSQDDGSEEDLCSKCLSVVYSIDNYEPHHYQFQELCDDFYIPETYSE